MRTLTAVTAVVVALTLAACQDDPTGPGAVLEPTEPSLTESTVLERCQALLDPDELCDAEELRDRLCVLLLDGGVIEVLLQRPERRYRVTFEPQPDGSVRVSVVAIGRNGRESPAFTWVLSAEQRAAYLLDHCTDMVFRTAWTADGVSTIREHRAVEGLAMSLDIDASPGADLTARIDRSGASVDLTLERAADATSRGRLEIEAARDAGSGDDRVVALSADELPSSVTWRFDAAAQRVNVMTSEPVEKLSARIDDGTGTLPDAPEIDLRILALSGGIALTFAPGVELTSENLVGVAEAAVRSAGRTGLVVPPGSAGILLDRDDAGLSLMLRVIGARRVAWSYAPLVLEHRGAGTSRFLLDVRAPGLQAAADIRDLPAVATLTVTGRSTSSAPGPAVTWSAASATEQIDFLLADDAILGGGALALQAAQIPTAFDLTLDATGLSTEPIRFSFEASAPMGQLALLLEDLFGEHDGRLRLVNVPRNMDGCVTEDGGCS